MQAAMVVRRAVYYLARAASTYLIRKRSGPRDVGECSRWKSIAGFDGGHGHLQKKRVYRLISAIMVTPARDHMLQITLCIPGSTGSIANLLWSLPSLQRPTLCWSCLGTILPTKLPGHGQHLEGTQTQDSCPTSFSALQHLLAPQ